MWSDAITIMKTNWKIYLYRQLSVLLESGVTVLRALRILAEQCSGNLRRVILDLLKSIESGSSLTLAVSSRKDFFSEFEIGLIRCSELTGNFEANLSMLADYFEQSRKRRWKFVRGIFYSVVLFHAVILLPPLKSLFFEGLGSYLRAVLPPLGILYSVFAVIIVSVKIIGHLPKVSTACGRCLWSIPVIGTALRNFELSIFTTCLAVSLRAGLTPAIALDISAEASGSAVIKSAVSGNEEILKEEGIAEFLKEAGIFPGIMLNMVFTGEESGKIDETLFRIASDLGDEASNAIDRLLVVSIVLIYLAAVFVAVYVIMTSYARMFQDLL